jgi:peptide/nickel transport system ATP-binding protein
VGESGSGKTTAGRLIVRLERPNSGRIRLNGTDITHLRGRALKQFRRKVQMVFQDPYQSLNPQLSVAESVAEPLVIHRISDVPGRRRKSLEMLTAVGLTPAEDFLYRYPHQLSGGQRQRVAIARAMILEPDFVVADEPTSMLDASISAQIFNILTQLRAARGVTLLFITHSLAAARYLCDRIAVIYRGHLVESGPAEEVIDNPRHPYTQALLDALPRFGMREDRSVYGTLLTAQRKPAPQGCPFFERCRPAILGTCDRRLPPLEDVAAKHTAACFLANRPVSETTA